MHPHIVHRRPIAAARGGFTLVEMLVATTLVVLMMLMFAQIYLAAISSLGRQQASSRNDTKARLADLLLRGDLQRASYRTAPGSKEGILPLVKGEVVSQFQKGFFYLSENDQTNPTDDVLHFTTLVTRGIRNRDPSYYYGRCLRVRGPDGDGGVDGLEFKSVAPFDASQFSNHPELDDGDTANEVGASKSAEVIYFVRGGNLYRRTLLIRDTDLGGQLALHSAQPSTATAAFGSRIVPTNTVNEPSYYKAFDYSAFCQVNNVADPTADTVRFLGIDALTNLEDTPESLGRTMTRFGFAHPPSNQLYFATPPALPNLDPVSLDIVQARGVPVEYDDAGNFFGRPVHGETGSFQWRWPGERFNALLNPLSYNTQTNELSVSGTQVIDPDTSRTRMSEDLLLSNVESFDAEVWDSGLDEDLDGDGVLDTGEDLNNNGYLDIAEGFVQLGNGASTGYFRSAARLNPYYGPGADRTGYPLVVTPAMTSNTNRNWVFDTGHPDMWTDDPYQRNPFTAAVPNVTAPANVFKPPYRPLLYRLPEDVDADGVLDTEDSNGNNSLELGEDANSNGVLDTEDMNFNGILDIPAFPTRVAGFWAPATRYRTGDVVFNPLDTTFSIAYRCIVSGEDSDGSGLLNGTEDGSQGLPGSLHTAGTLDWAQSGATTPIWNQVLGERTIESTRLHGPNVAASDFSEDTNNNSSLDPGEDANGNGQLDLYTPSSLTWQAFDNRVGLKKIRITLRVRDPIEGTARQFSIVHSFVNPDN